MIDQAIDLENAATQVDPFRANPFDQCLHAPPPMYAVNLAASLSPIRA